MGSAQQASSRPVHTREDLVASRNRPFQVAGIRSFFRTKMKPDTDRAAEKKAEATQNANGSGATTTTAVGTGVRNARLDIEKGEELCPETSLAI